MDEIGSHGFAEHVNFYDVGDFLATFWITIEMSKIWSNELRYFGQLGFLCWLSSRAYLWHYSKLYAEICWYIYIYISNYGAQRQICKANVQYIFQQLCKFHVKWCELLKLGPLISTYFMIHFMNNLTTSHREVRWNDRMWEWHGRTVIFSQQKVTLWLFNIAMENGPFMDDLHVFSY